MKYLVVGAGGTGGILAGYLARQQKEVTLIARGDHLKEIRQNGLIIEDAALGNLHIPVKACGIEEYVDTPDIIFLCVKAYSLEEVAPFVEEAGARGGAYILPLLNGVGTGDRLAAVVKGPAVLDGCIYIFGNKLGPGKLANHSKTIRICYGTRDASPLPPDLRGLETDLVECGIVATPAPDVRYEIFRKFAYVSPMAALGSRHHVNAGQIVASHELQDAFVRLVGEVQAVAAAMGVTLESDLAHIHLQSMKAADPASITSLQRDLEAGGHNELEVLVFDMVRRGGALGVEVPCYREIARHHGYQE